MLIKFAIDHQIILALSIDFFGVFCEDQINLDKTIMIIKVVASNRSDGLVLLVQNYGLNIISFCDALESNVIGY